VYQLAIIVKIESAIIFGVATIALVLGGFAIGMIMTHTEQLDIANSKITILQNNYNDLLTRFNDLQTCCSGFEKLEIINMYSSPYNSNTNSWTVTITVNNTGCSDVTVTCISVNSGGPIFCLSPANTPLPSIIVQGAQQVFLVLLTFPSFDHGQTVDIMLLTASGDDYSRAVVLP
jgi:hypothetical protein